MENNFFIHQTNKKFRISYNNGETEFIFAPSVDEVKRQIRAKGRRIYKIKIKHIKI